MRSRLLLALKISFTSNGYLTVCLIIAFSHEFHELTTAEILATVRRYWGYSELRPLQEQAIRAGLEHRDSLVVMPTGGGKSLCYQVPAELAQRTDIVVSPLISLMKDQVDGLRECGYPAAALYSGMPAHAVQETEEQIAAGRYRLLFVAPERLLTPRFLGSPNASASRLRHRRSPLHQSLGPRLSPGISPARRDQDRFPRASVHAYTATATERVRADIAAQLRLNNPASSSVTSTVRISSIASFRASTRGRRLWKCCNATRPGRDRLLHQPQRHRIHGGVPPSERARSFLSRRHGSRRTPPHAG